MTGQRSQPVHIRTFVDDDEMRVTALADRLLIGIAPWRDPTTCTDAVRHWVEASIERDSSEGILLVATDSADQVVGFVSVETSIHFSGEPQAYIGELVVDEEAEGNGIGRLLVEAAERWAKRRQFRTLTLVTGAANDGAIAFYGRLGFLAEEVRLTKLLD